MKKKKKSNKNLTTGGACSTCSTTCLLSLNYAAERCVQSDGSYPKTELEFEQWGCPIGSPATLINYAKTGSHCISSGCQFNECPCANDIINCVNINSEDDEAILSCLAGISTCCVIGLNGSC